MNKNKAFCAAGILLAAGNSSRFGAPKQLARIDSEPLLFRTLKQFDAARLDASFLVIGAFADKIKPLVPTGTQLIEIENWHEGMGTSIAGALKYLTSPITNTESMPFSHVLIGLADQINLTTAGFNQLLEQARQNPDKIVAASYNQTFGAPCVFPEQYFSALAAFEGWQGAKKLIKQHITSTTFLPLPEATVDIDTQDQLKLWQKSRE